MVKAFSAILWLALTACAGVQPPAAPDAPCAQSEASYACQVERYHNVAQ